ncbi:FMN-dependent dehydrogenase-domain-containing protein [Elsinoe ampelina]|uniref:L-lactate dehydrogenase (cytochrome) n=1 Tax=Elsinoe ampelina TaxID=302913 RepID=A0A6A6G6Y2_9PEZI|nr:FMN-dependent dehydrogenase-domain-containing protein [Elsinoe ampelina]
MSKVFTYNEVQQHRSVDSCWVVLYGNVYDVTKFLPDHPGGSKIILQLAGTDATEEYDPIHPPGTLEESLPAEAKLGSFDISTLPAVEKSPVDKGKVDEDEIPPLEDMLNLDDIEAAATKQLSKKAWAYYYSAADDLRSKHLNNLVYSSILLRPRIFVDCTRCDTSTTLLGHKLKVPFYVSPAAMARLGHPDGEHGIARACDTYGALQIISNNASQTPEQIVAGASPDQMFGWQLYVQTERKKSEDMLARIHKLPDVKFICLTLDAPVPGKREHDERSKNVGGNLPVRAAVTDGAASSAKPSTDATRSGGVGKALFAGTAPDLTWKTTLPWLEKHTHLPIVLKGIQTHEDAYMASLHAPLVKGIILSNHGGRAADTAPPAIHTLIEIRKYCPEVFGKIEVWVDGGIKRGTDVVKALCLGAKAVGMGRAPLFGLGAGGTAGVERVLEIIKAETKTAMRLLGAERVDQLGPQHVSCIKRDAVPRRRGLITNFQINARAVERDVYDGPAGLEKLGMWLQSKL